MKVHECIFTNGKCLTCGKNEIDSFRAPLPLKVEINLTDIEYGLYAVAATIFGLSVTIAVKTF